MLAAELESKADAYNAAIAQSNNRQILLNAVRASQRAPMSFVGFGDVAATPTFSGSANGTFNFDPLGLTTYVVVPGRQCERRVQQLFHEQPEHVRFRGRASDPFGPRRGEVF